MEGRDQGRQDGGRAGTREESPEGGRPHVRARSLVIRRQSFLYIFLIGLGFVLIHMNNLRNPQLVTEGVVFIVIGIVGLIMSWTTHDVGQGVRDAVVEDGDKTRDRLDDVVAAIDRVGASVEKVGASVDAMSKDNKDFFRQMLERQDAILERQDAMGESQKAMIERQDAMRESQKAMIERQDAMRESQKAMIERQDAMRESQKAMMESQKAMMEKAS